MLSVPRAAATGGADTWRQAGAYSLTTSEMTMAAVYVSRSSLLNMEDRMPCPPVSSGALSADGDVLHLWYQPRSQQVASQGRRCTHHYTVHGWCLPVLVLGLLSEDGCCWPLPPELSPVRKLSPS